MGRNANGTPEERQLSASVIARHSRADLALPSTLFFLSGAVSLGYEVLWFKRFTLVWGSSSVAMAAVVAVFLLGLGVGAAVIGRRADRVRAPLLWYGVLEAGIGLAALLVPLEIELLGRLTPVLGSALGGWPLAHMLVRSALTLIVLGPPSVLMGGTLPLLVRQFARNRAELDGTLAWLYAINTFGAGAGSLIIGFVVLPALGLRGTNNLLVGIGVLVGGGACLLSRRLAALGAAPAAGTVLKRVERAGGAPGHGDEAGRFRIICAVVAITGLASLSLQMIWSRQLAVLVGGSTYAFSACLGVFLTGIAAGSLVHHLFLRRSRAPFSVAAWTILVLIGSTVAGRLLLPSLTDLMGAVSALRSSAPMNAVVCLLAAGALQFIPTACMGVLLPLLMQNSPHRDGHSGRAVGTLYAWNVAGSVVGALITVPLLTPLLGITWVTTAALALYVVVIPLVLPWEGWKTPAACAAGLLLTVATLFPLPTLRTELGQYMYGYVPPEVLARWKVLFFREGASSNVLVTEQEQGRSLRVNGKVDAGTKGDMGTQLGSAYLPRALKPGAKDVFIIGFGSGCTAGASLLFPGTEVTVCEIEPAVIAASPWFHGINHAPEQSERFHAVIDDARSRLQASDRAYDLILSEPSNPWVAGVSSLYTEEFYRTVVKRLKPGGMLAQWVQLYALRPADYEMVARTMLSVFSDVAVVRISDGDTLILGSDTPLMPDAATVTAAQRLFDGLPEVRSDMRAYFKTTDLRTFLLSSLLLNRDDLVRLAGAEDAGPLNTDSNLRLEFDSPLRLFDRSARIQDLPEAALFGAASPGWTRQLYSAWECGPGQLQCLKDRLLLFAHCGRADAARSIGELGLSVGPADPFFLVQRITLSPELRGDALTEAARRLIDSSEADALGAAGALNKARQYDRAAVILTMLSERQPGSATVWGNLAVSLSQTGKLEAADAALKRAMAADPLCDFAKVSTGALSPSAAAGVGTEP